MEVTLERQANSMIQLFEMPFEFLSGGHHHLNQRLQNEHFVIICL